MKVDKSKWEKRKLGEVCQIISGSTPKTQEPKNWENGTWHWVTPAELKGEKYVSNTERKVTDYAIEHTNITLMPIGTVLLSSRAPIGKVAITKVPMYCNQGFKNLVCSDLMYNEYLYYYLKGQTEHLNYLGNGVTFKEISKKIVQDIKISIPPISEQHTIVSELDTLQSFITQYREQLNDYDKLAQSIFYEMFGDVVVNEKGWTCNPFHKLFSLRSGDGLTAKQQISGNFLVYGGNGINGSHTQYNKDGEYIIIGRVGAYCGNVRYVSGKFWLTDNAFELKEKLNPQNKYYLQYLLQNLNLGHYAHKAAQPVISNTVLKDIPIPLPPLPLQQQFASRIESIEVQKALIKQQLADAQTLFDSRMQYYFN